MAVPISKPGDGEAFPSPFSFLSMYVGYVHYMVGKVRVQGKGKGKGKGIGGKGTGLGLGLEIGVRVRGKGWASGLRLG